MKNKRKIFHGFTIVELLIVISLIGILAGMILGNSILSGFFQFPFWIVFGWIRGLFQWLKGLTIEPAALMTGFIAFPLFLYFLHRTIRAFNSDWPFRRSIGLAGILLAVSVSAIALICAVHNIYWLKRTNIFFEIAHGSGYYRLETENRLKIICISASDCQNIKHSFLGGGFVRKQGDLDHSWMTHLLPYLGETDLYESIHRDKSWRAPENKEPFSKKVSAYQNFTYTRLQHKNDEGYSLSGFAVNQCVLPTGGVSDLDKIPDGAANTILLGTVSENYRPWGDPVNARDPLLGLNASPYGFGGYGFSETVLFGFCDGSIHSLNKKIDPQILRALSMPNDGEKIELDRALRNKGR